MLSTFVSISSSSFCPVHHFMDTNILRLSQVVIRERGKTSKKEPCILSCKWHHFFFFLPRFISLLFLLEMQVYFLRPRGGGGFPGVGEIELILYLEAVSSLSPIANISGF